MDETQLRVRVWQSLLNADFAERYYQCLAARIARRNKILSGAVIVLGSGTLTALVAPIRETWGVPTAQLLALLSALLGVYLFSSRPERTSILSALESQRWGGILDLYEQLWMTLDANPPADALEQWLTLQAQERRGAETAPVEFPEIHRLRKRAWKEVEIARRLQTAPAESPTTDEAAVQATTEEHAAAS